jgi:hypothetical protein
MAGVASERIEVEASVRAGASREVDPPLDSSGRRLRIILLVLV